MNLWEGMTGRFTEGDNVENDEEADDFFEAKLNSVTIGNERRNSVARVWLREADYEGDDLILGRYLETLQRPGGLSDQQFMQLRRKAHHFLVRDGYLFKRGRKRGSPPRRVIGTTAQRREVIRGLHDEIGHRGRLATYNQVQRRYQWKGIWGDVVEYVKSCEQCQKRARIRYEEPLHPTFSRTVWERIGVDVVYMPETPEGYKYIVFARDDLSGWSEGRALKENNSRNVARFLYEDVICRHGCPIKVVVDGGSENKLVAKSLLEDYRVKRILVSAYHPQANGLVERGHDAIVNSLSKYCSQQQGKWVDYLPLALWADRISVRRSTGHSAFELLYGRDCLLPVELSVASWSMIDWEGEVSTREDLLVARMRQLDQRTLVEAAAAEELVRSRQANKAYFDQNKRLRTASLHVGNLVLLHNTILEHSHSRKLDDKWRGPYRIREVVEDSTFYRLEELDGTALAASFAGNRLKLFFKRAVLDDVRMEVHDAIRVRREGEGMEEEENVDGEEENMMTMGDA